MEKIVALPSVSKNDWLNIDASWNKIVEAVEIEAKNDISLRTAVNLLNNLIFNPQEFR